jgi:transposase
VFLGVPRMIMIDSKSQLIVDIIAKVSEGKIAINNAAKLLNRSRRTIERYLNRYQTLGIKFIMHGNVGKKPVNKISNNIKLKVQSLIKDKYYDVNLQHLAELLDRNENLHVKRETLRKWAHDIHHVKRAKRRRSQARKRRERMESAGLLLQMDGSTHQWFGDYKSCLIAIIDDATSEVHAEFFKSETTQGCLKVMRDYIEKKGVFKALYVDKAGIFAGPKRCNFSQMQRACEELGIEIIFANSPQGKGRIERSFDTFQDRLIPELRLKKINDMQSANRYLQESFIPNFWQKTLTVVPKNLKSEFTSVPEYLNLDDICVQKEYRKIRNDHTFSYGNKFYLIDSPLKNSIAKQEIEIRIQQDGSFTAYFAGRLLIVSQVIEPTQSSLYDVEIQKKINAIELAEKLGNVSEAARISGCSRETIYRNKRILKEKGPLSLKRIFRHNLIHKNRTAKNIEEIVIQFSIENPHLGQAQISTQIKANFDIDLSPSGVRQIWLRENMNTKFLRNQKAQSFL